MVINANERATWREILEHGDQRRMARKIGVHHNTINNAFNKGVVSRATYIKICAYVSKISKEIKRATELDNIN